MDAGVQYITIKVTDEAVARALVNQLKQLEGEASLEPGALISERGLDLVPALAASVVNERVATLERELAELKALFEEPAVFIDEGVIRLNENRMVPHQVYEVDTAQGPMQFVKESSGAIRVYEVYESREDQVAEATQS